LLKKFFFLKKKIFFLKKKKKQNKKNRSQLSETGEYKSPPIAQLAYGALIAGI